MFTTASETRARAARRRVQAAARRGARQKIRDFFIRDFFIRLPSAIWGALFYFVLSFTGVIYSWSFYQQFNIYIFDFFDTSDFLLSAFQNLVALLIGVIATLFVIATSAYLLYNSIVYRALSFLSENEQAQQSLIRREAGILLAILLAASTLFILSLRPWWDDDFSKPGFFLTTILLFIVCALAYRFTRLVYSPVSRIGQESLDRWEASVLLSIVLAMSTVGIPYYWGITASEEKKNPEYKDRTRITIRQGAGRPQAHLPYPAILIGTTSNFYFFYGCENEKKREMFYEYKNNLNCEEDRPFVVPTANIASLEFNPSDCPSKAPCIPLPPDRDSVVAAIDKINKTITALNAASKRNTSKVVKAIGELDLDPMIEIFPEIGLDLPEVAQAIDKLTAAIVASEFHPDPIIIALKATIAELNATSRALNISGVVNSCAFGGELLGIVQPFQDQLEGLFAQMDSHFRNNTLYQLILIGRIDSEPAGTEERRSYGSQRGLAQAQVEWVQEKILKRFQGQIDPSRIIPRLLPPGASLLRMSTAQDPHFEYEPSIAPSLRARTSVAREHGVEVHACWAPSPEQASFSANSAP